MRQGVYGSSDAEKVRVGVGTCVQRMSIASKVERAGFLLDSDFLHWFCLVPAILSVPNDTLIESRLLVFLHLLHLQEFSLYLIVTSQSHL